MLILKPKGRGNWRTATMQIDGERGGALLVSVGQTVTLGGIVWRICEVRP